MEFKKLLNKVHDKVSQNTLSTTPTLGNSAPVRRRSFKDKKHATLSRWRDKWGDVSRPRFFSNNNNKNSNNKTNRNDAFCPPLPTSVAALASPPPTVPIITVSSPTLLKRSQSTIGPRPAPKTNYFVHKKQRPISYTPTLQNHQRLTATHGIGQLPTTYEYTSSGDNSDDDENAGSLYNHPILGVTPRQVSWYIPQHTDSLDDSIDLDHESITSIPSTIMKSSSSYSTSSSSSSSSSAINLLLPKNTVYSTMDRHVTPQFRGHDSAFQDNGTFKQLNKESKSDDASLLIPTTPQQETRGHYQLVTLNVAHTMMVMREHQLELQMAKTRIENQRLQQQMEDMISGTWTSTTQLLVENDRLELQIQQLQQRQHFVRSSINYNDPSRQTNHQQGLINYLDSKPDMVSALDQLKRKLLASR
ncbi:hypothetical protein BC941DRAFT_450004 [Chlamydoabsidia padenii]|nr:hypothetical protein BC941DRAFT_450004 [Chlamydoabsidia padenii]